MRSMSSLSSAFNSRTTFAGRPNAKLFGGMTLPGGTRLPAPINAPSPISAQSKIMEPITIKAFLRIVQLCKVTWCPTVTSSSIMSGYFGLWCKQQRS